MYATNDMKFTVSCDVASNTNGGARYLYLKLYLQDKKTTLHPPFGIDEYVTGTVTNTVRMYRPSGTNVNVTAPTPTTTTSLTSGS